MHLDTRSWYSFHDGVASPAEILAHAAELGFTELGLADVDGTYGLIHAYKAALKCGVKPVLGIALTDSAGETPAPPAAAHPEPAAWVFARDRDGYSELCLLAALRHGCMDAAGPFDLARALAAHTEHCVVITERAGLLEHLAPRLGPRRLFVRVDPDYGAPYRSRQLRQLKLAARFGLQVVACTDVRFLRPQDQSVHHVLRAIGQNATLHTAEGMRPRQHYLAAPTELSGYYYGCPEALAQARALALQCEVDFELGKWVFPDYPLKGGGDPRRALYQLCQHGLSKRGISQGDGRYLARLEMELSVIATLGYTSYFLAVYDIVREARRCRIPCLGRGSAANSLVSYLLGLTPVDPIRYDMYFERFLNPQRTSPPDIDIDFNWKRRDEILEYVYQRWGRERVAMISTHVTFQARSAIREVAKVFGLGGEEISQVSKFLPHVSAAALPMVQREFPELRGIDLASEPYCHVLPLAARLDGRPRHLGIHCGGVVIAPTRVTDYTGLQRAAKGFVVTQYDMFPVEDVGLIKIDLLGNRSLGVLEDTLTALEQQGPRAKGRGPREDSSHQDNIRRVITDWETLATDPSTVEMIRSGLTMGCFYIESPGMRQLLRRLRTKTFLDLTAASSVIRPGVAESGMMQEYIRRVRGEAPRLPSHPLMAEIMPETHGVMIYQEDVIKVAHRAAGMTLADADLLRRAMSGKLRSQSAMNQLRERFIAGCEKSGLDLASALEIWRQIASFAGYSFCKAHSASFATLSFQVAYLKAHHPAEFMAAVLSNGGGFYGPRAYLSECERLGLAVLPPDVNYSRLEYTAECSGGAGVPARDERGPRAKGQGPRAEGDSRSGGVSAADSKDGCGGPPHQEAVRVGLSLIKDVSTALLSRIVSNREQCGPYRSLPDFIRRTAPGEHDLAVLIKVGALDSLGLSRPELLYLAQIEHRAAVLAAGHGGADRRVRQPQRIADRAVRATEDNRGQAANAAPRQQEVAQPLPLDDSERIADFRARIGSTLDGYDELKLCSLELEHLGILVRRHPLTLYQRLVSGVVNAADLPRYAGKWVRLLGWCIAVKRVDLTRRQAVRDTLELHAEHADHPEMAADEDGDSEEEREGTAEDLGIVLRSLGRADRRVRQDNRGQGRPPSLEAGEIYAPTRRAMKFMSMEDLTGTFEVTLFADAYARFAPLTRFSGPFLVAGKVEEQFDTYTLNATELRLLSLDDSGAAPQPPSPSRSQSIRSAGRAKTSRGPQPHPAARRPPLRY